MTKIEALFLEAFGAALKNEQVTWTQPLTGEEWEALFRMASQHHVQPMIYETVGRCPAAQNGGRDDAVSMYLLFQKHSAMQMMMLQTQMTSEFLQIYQSLRAAGVQPLVVKGIVCRSLYPKPDQRISGDEDLLVQSEEFALCHKILTDLGMTVADPEMNIEEAYEVPYNRMGSAIYLEIHKSLFPPEQVAYGGLNQYFVKAHEYAVEASIGPDMRVTIRGKERAAAGENAVAVNGAGGEGEPLNVEEPSVVTLPPTDHLFYLICHAFKHFLHSGVGIRQAADMALFANAYGAYIDWEQILENCRQIHAEKFAAAIFRIGEKYLCFDPDRAGYPASWRAINMDESALLMDILSGGVYGDSSMSRKHSSTITLNAAEAGRKGKRSGSPGSLLRTVFPSARDMKGRYPYLGKHPVLMLPRAWVSRILHYYREMIDDTGPAARGNNSVAESVRIGNQRVALMKEYDILE